MSDLMDKLKEMKREMKLKDKITSYNSFLNVITSMFKWEGLPDSIRPEYIEMYLNLYGQCAIAPDREGKLAAVLVDRGGAPDTYGLGTTPIISTLNGYTETYQEVINDVMYGADGKRGVIIYNSNTKTPNCILDIACNLMTEALTSFVQNIIHSRYNPLFAVNSDVIKKAVENSMADIIAGKPVVIVADNILQEIETGQKALEIVNLTDVDKQEKIQFISKTIDDILRWFLSIFGQNVSGNGKLAQQTVDEVNGTQGASFVIPEMMWRCRQKGAELINATFGFNVSVSYNKPWAVEMEKYTEDIEATEKQTEGKEGTEDEQI